MSTQIKKLLESNIPEKDKAKIIEKAFILKQRAKKNYVNLI